MDNCLSSIAYASLLFTFTLLASLTISISHWPAVSANIALYFNHNYVLCLVSKLLEPANQAVPW